MSRLREAAQGGRVVDLVVPIDSALLLTAREFRSLKDAIDEERIAVVLRTSDPLRLQLAERLGMRAQALPRPRMAAAPVAAAPVAVAAVARTADRSQTTGQEKRPSPNRSRGRIRSRTGRARTAAADR